MRNWYWLAISLCVHVAPAVAAPPAYVEIDYEIARNGTVLAEVEHVLEHDGREYRLTEVWKGRGLLALRGTATRTSRGLIAPTGLKPLEFTDERSGRHTARVTYDWKAGMVTMQYRGDPRTEALPPRAHDRLAFLFEFAFAAPRSHEVAFDLLDGRGQSRHVYVVAGRERLKTPMGDFAALKVGRITDDDRVDIWLATERSYIPLRVLVTEKDGTAFDQMAVKITTR
jgi:hypothetical protein